MKIRVDLECTPEEARRFLGLPDVTPLHDAAMGELQAKIGEAARNLDPNTLIQAWFPAGTGTWQKLQEAFWKQMAGAGQGGGAGSGAKGTGDKDT